MSEEQEKLVSPTAAGQHKSGGLARAEAKNYAEAHSDTARAIALMAITAHLCEQNPFVEGARPDSVVIRRVSQQVPDA